MAEQSLITELEGSFRSGSPARQVEILRRVTDLFLAGASVYSDEQVDLFDGVISRLADRIETKARAELANRLAPIANAPTTTVRWLARDDSIEVAAPILTRSSRLTDEDLLEIAENNSQERLLAISKRPALSESVGDALVIRGNRDVVLSVTQNEGARFSETGYDRLVERSIDDEVLAICVGMRKDIPREQFHTLIAQASEVVFKKLAANNPAAVQEVQRVLTGITGQEVRAKREPIQFDSAAFSGQAAEALIQEFAANGDFQETIAALSALSRAPRALVETVMSDRRGDNDFTLLLAKAAGLSWPTALQLCIMRRGPGGMPAMAIDAARSKFERLKVETAQRVVRFYNARHSAVANFEELAQSMRA
jgi:hypothetical protein